MDLYFYDSIGPTALEQTLSVVGKKEDINVHINSPGGEVYAGLAIFNTLISTPNKVNVSVDGLAASMASVVAMSGNDITMSENSMLMIHNSRILAGGTKEEIQKQAEQLDKVDEIMINIYVAQTGQRRRTIQKLMEKETFLTAKEAKELGFITNIKKAEKIAAHLNINEMEKVENVLNNIKAKFTALTGTVTDAPEEDVLKLQEAADEIAEDKLEAKAGEKLGDQLTREMVTEKDYQKFVALSTDFATAAMDHIEKTQVILDGLADDIKAEVGIQMRSLLSTVRSKTEVPAATNGFNEAEEEDNKEAEVQKLVLEKERNRTLKP